MTSPENVLKEFARAPFELYKIRGCEFTILENLPYTGTMREVKEMNKWNKMQDFFFIKIEQGMFQKDLKMSESEMLALFLAMPKGITNYCGAMISVDAENKMKLKYIGSTDQDLNGNRLSAAQNAPISQPQQPQDQKDVVFAKIVNSIQTLEALGNKVDTSVLMKICESIHPGKALDLIKAAKDGGYIVESAGIYRAP